MENIYDLIKLSVAILVFMAIIRIYMEVANYAGKKLGIQKLFIKLFNRIRRKE